MHTHTLNSESSVFLHWEFWINTLRSMRKEVRMSPTKLIWNLTTSIVCLLPPGGTKHHREQVNPKKALLKLSPGALGKQRPAEGFRAVKWLPRAGIGQGSGRDRAGIVVALSIKHRKTQRIQLQCRFHAEMTPWQTCPNRIQVHDLN